MDRPVFIALTRGLVVQIGDKRLKVTHLLTSDSFLGTDLKTGQPERCRASDITGCPNEDSAAPSGIDASMPDIAAVPDRDWAVAQKRFSIIQPLLNQPTRRRSDVENAAAAAGVHAATVYDWIRAFERSDHVTSLLPGKAGRRHGTKFIDPHIEAIVKDAIDRQYLNKQRKLPTRVVKAVQEDAKKAGLTAPHANTVRRRINDLDPRDTTRRRGERVARELLEPRPGEYPETSYFMQVVQIDHTPGDVQGLDEADRHPLGRPWITLAIDVFTRMVLAIIVSYERPNAATVGECISQMMLPKGPVLAALGLEGDWPVRGKPEKVFVDNAKEFDSKTIKDACKAYGIGLEFRPIATPNFGGHIERLMLTNAQELRNIPGATFSNPKARGENKPEKEAVMTIDEIERYVFDFFVNDYNMRPHTGIDRNTPLGKFKDAIAGGPESMGTGLAKIPTNPERVRIDFLEVFERTVLRRGVRIEGVYYYDPVIAPYINAQPSEYSLPNGKFIFRRDRRRISPIYFWDQRTKTHVPIHYANRTRPVISLWELKATARRLKAEGAKNVDEDKLMEAYTRRQEMIEDASTATRLRRKELRLDVQRRKATERAVAQASGNPPNARETKRAMQKPLEAEEDIFSEPAVKPDIIDLNPSRR